MDIKFPDIVSNIRLQILILSLAGYFAIKFLFFDTDSMIIILLNELLVLFIAYVIIINLITVIGKNKFDPIPLVVSIGLVNVFILVQLHLSDTFLEMLGFDASNAFGYSNTFSRVLAFFNNFLTIVLVAYLLIAMRELFFLRQRKNLRNYYNVMLLFIILASGTAFVELFDDWKFINIALTITAIILIAINSFRIAWIAFLKKKDKRNLLLLSIPIIALFAYNLSFTFLQGSGHNVMTRSFSYSANHFFFLVNVYGIVYFGVLLFTTLFHLPTAEAFDRKAKEISSLQYFSKLINQVLDFRELADTITELSLQFSNASSAWIIMEDDDTKTPVAPKNIGYLDADKIYKFAMSKYGVSSNQGVTVVNLSELYKTESADQRYTYAAIAPLKTYHKSTGYLIVANKSDERFDDEDKNAYRTFTDYAAIAIENANLLEESIEKERLEKELDVAREMQKRILPGVLPKLQALEIATVFIPAFEVGGDYYDFFNLDEDRLGFIIADVSGKGITAAFVMAELRGIMESITRVKKNSDEILILANDILKRTLESNTFVTAVFGIIHLQEKTLKLARAGHTPVLLVRGEEIQEIVPQGIGLGIDNGEMFNRTIEEFVMPLQENDLIVLSTDGVTEAKNQHFEDFGDERLKNLILQHRMEPSEKISNIIVKELSLFSQSNSQHDDITLVILRWKN